MVYELCYTTLRLNIWDFIATSCRGLGLRRSIRYLFYFLAQAGFFVYVYPLCCSWATYDFPGKENSCLVPVILFSGPDWILHYYGGLPLIPHGLSDFLLTLLGLLGAYIHIFVSWRKHTFWDNSSLSLLCFQLFGSLPPWWSSTTHNLQHIWRGFAVLLRCNGSSSLTSHRTCLAIVDLLAVPFLRLKNFSFSSYSS